MNNNYTDSPLDLIEGRLFFERKGKSEYDGIKNVEFRRNNARHRPEKKRSIALIEVKCFRANLILVRFYRKITVRFVQVVKAFICCVKVYTFQQLFVHVIVKIQYYSFLLVFILEIYIKLCYIV